MESINVQEEPLSKTRKLRSRAKKDEEVSHLANIDKLNDHCLIRVLNFLSVAERIRVERVSKRWQEISKESWSKMKVLDFNQKNLGLKPHGKNHEYPKILKPAVEKLLKRCGRYLEKLTIALSFSFDYESLVAKFCKNIQSLTLGKVSVMGLEKLAATCENITDLWICSYSNDPLNPLIDEAIGNFFSNNKNLKVLKIDDYVKIGECLLKLPLDEIEEIKVFSASSYSSHLKKNLTKVIRESKKLRSFEYYSADETVLSSLALACNNLIVLNLQLDDDHSRVVNLEKMLSQVFKNNKNLKSLKLRYFESLTGECLLWLDKNAIEEISLDSINKLQRGHLIKSFSNLKKLHTLEFSNIECENCDHINECISLCGNLKKLTIDDLGYSDAKLMSTIGGLKNLETLAVCRIRSSIVNKNFIDRICCNLVDLKYLDLTGCLELTDRKLKSLVKLSKLEVLNISGLSKITGSGLGPFPNLKELHCSDCGELEISFFEKLLKCSTNLNYLDIANEDFYTEDVIKIAIEETKKRTNNVMLDLNIAFGQVNYEKINDTSPLLHLKKYERYY